MLRGPLLQDNWIGETFLSQIKRQTQKSDETQTPLRSDEKQTGPEELEGYQARDERSTSPLAKQIFDSEREKKELQRQLIRAATQEHEHVEKIAQLSQENELLRKKIAAHKTLQDAQTIEFLELRRHCQEADQRLNRVKDTMSFRLGHALIESVQSFAGLRALPLGLIKVYQKSRELRQKRLGGQIDKYTENQGRRHPIVLPPAQALSIVKEASRRGQKQGILEAARWVEQRRFPPPIAARALMELSKDALSYSPLLAVELGLQALQKDASEPRIRWLAFSLYESGHLTEAEQILSFLVKSGGKLSATEENKLEHVQALLRLKKEAELFEKSPLPPVPSRIQERNKRLLFFSTEEILQAQRSIIETWTHRRALAAQAAGWDPLIVLSSACSTDHFSGTQSRQAEGGISYLRLRKNIFPEHLLEEYLAELQQTLVQLLEEEKAEVIFARGSSLELFAVARAARKYGCPFILDLPTFLDPICSLLSIHAPMSGRQLRKTESSRIALSLVLASVRSANLCLTSNPFVRRVLERFGIESSKIRSNIYALPADHLSPSFKNVSLMQALKIDEKAAVIGYIGELSLDRSVTTFIHILNILKETHPHLHVLLVGEGNESATLRDLAAHYSVESKVLLREEVWPYQKRDFYSLMDIALFAGERPGHILSSHGEGILEAIAHGRAIVAPRTPISLELIEDGETGILHRAHQLEDLALIIGELLNNPVYRTSLGKKAYVSFKKQARFTHAVRQTKELLEDL